MSGFSNFVREIHRRSLWQVLAIYAVGAWVGYSVIQGLTEGLGLPTWFPALALVLFIVGLPIVLATAFVQEGMGKAQAPDPTLLPSAERAGAAAAPSAAGARDRRLGRLLTWRHAIVGGALAFGLWGVIATVWLLQESSPPAVALSDADQRPSIAVLPFTDLSPEGDNEYFADGMAEELLNALARIPGLRVAARTSSFAFKGQNVDVRTVGDALGVSTVLEGSIRKEADNLRITAQLINVGDGFHLWSDTYERRLESVFAIQEEIAAAIARALRVPLGLAAEERLVDRRTADVEAYELYLQGRFLFNQRGPALQRAVTFFERAIARDSSFGPAYAGLAETVALLPYYRLGDWDESFSRAEEMARRALALDSTLAYAHNALANILRDRWHWTGAEREYRIALRLDPEAAEVHNQYGQFLMAVGRTAEALESFSRARELDPLSPIINTVLGWALTHARLYPEAVDQLKHAVDLDPNFPFSHRRLYWAYLLTSRFDEAEGEARRWAELVGVDPALLSLLVSALAEPRRRSEALEALDTLDLVAFSDGGGDPELWLASFGEHDRLFELLHRQNEIRAGLITFLWSPALDPIRDDPRFEKHLQEIGLPYAP